MSKRIKMIQFLIIATFGLSLTACDNAIFSKSNSNGNKAVGVTPPGTGGPGIVNENGDLIFLDDSFEREDLFGDIANNMIVGWRGAWDDHGTLGTGFTGNQLGMEIFTDQEMGPAFDGNSATYFYGRPGSSVHTLWLISPAYDLSNYNSVIMNYRYLTVALNDQMDIDANYIEGIQLQVCNASANDCGANADFVDLNNIGNDANWVTIAASDPNENDDVFDGTNQQPSDYITDLAVFDLNGVVALNNNGDTFDGDKSEVVFRFQVDLRDGFANSGGSTNPDYNEELCEKYTKKKKYYCKKKEYKCKKADHYAKKCDEDRRDDDDDSSDDDKYSVSTLLTQTSRPSDHDCGKYRNCSKARHYAKKCERYTEKCEKYTKKMKKYCDKGEPTTGGALVDGVILDLVQGRATETPIDELF